MSNPLPSVAPNPPTAAIPVDPSSSVWDRISSWASENKAAVYTIAGVVVAVTGAGAVYYLTSDSVRSYSFGGGPCSHPCLEPRIPDRDSHGSGHGLTQLTLSPKVQERCQPQAQQEGATEAKRSRTQGCRGQGGPICCPIQECFSRDRIGASGS